MKKIITFFILLASAIGIQAQNTWVVAGVGALCGEAWKGDAEINKMASEDGTTFTLVKTECKLKAGTAYQYKFVKNGTDWYGNDETDPTTDAPNYELKVEENGLYTVTFTFNTTTLLGNATAVKTGDAVFGTDTWTLAGVTALFGTSWNTEDTNNDMVAGDDGITFTLTKEDVILEAGVKYEYKVAQNHGWDVAYGEGDGNASLVVEENGKYKVVFTFVNDDTHSLTAVATKIGDVVIADKVWTIAGSEVVLGSGWNNEDKANDMIKQADNTYVLVKKNVKLFNGYNYEFRVLSNHSWDENYGMNGVAGGSNYIISVDKDGIYDITFTWNYEKRDMSVTFDKTGDYSVSTWTVVGDEALCGSFWDYSDAKNDMITVDNVNYVLVKKGLKLETDTDY